MEQILGIIGILLFIFVTVDIIWTTLWVDGGAGPITNLITSIVWKGMKMFDRKGQLLQLSGPVILVVILVMWILLSWVASFLMLLFLEDPLINTINSRTLTNFDLFYYTGYTLFTFGNGEFAPSTRSMQLLSVLISAYGMVILSLIISYVLGVIDGVVQKRSIASNVSALGESAEDFLQTNFNGEAFYDLSAYFNEISSELGTLTARQKAYPLLNYFHSNDPANALSYVLPVLADSLWVMKFGLSEEVGVKQPYVQKTLSAIDGYISSSTILISQTDEDISAPELPDYEALVAAGIPLISKEAYKADFEDVDETRTYLYRIKRENFETVLEEL